MKSRYAVLLVTAIFAGLILSQKAIAGNHGGPSNGNQGGGQGGIPLSAGQFSQTFQGSFALCLDPTSFAEESCSTTAVLVIPLSILDNGVIASDETGNSCATITEVDSDLPVDASPPNVTANEHSVGTLLNYDSTTGTGNGSFTNYIGGACNGATFDSTGATELASGTNHFVVTDNGNRVDFLITSITNPTGSIGDFSASGTNLRQTRSGF
jgi:hypothetical protein